MNFGDWEMFRVLIVSLREHEMTNIGTFNETRTTTVAATKPVSVAKPQIRDRKSMLGTHLTWVLCA